MITIVFGYTLEKAMILPLSKLIIKDLRSNIRCKLGYDIKSKTTVKSLLGFPWKQK